MDNEKINMLRRHAGPGVVNNILLDWLEEIVVDISRLREEVAALQQAGAGASQEIQALTEQVVALREAGADNISQADLDALTDNVHAVATTLNATTAAAQGQPVGNVADAAPAATTAPGGPASAAAQSTEPGQAGPGQTAADTQTQTTPATGAAQTTPPPAATDPAQAGQTPAPTSGAAAADTGTNQPTTDGSGRTMYVFDGDDATVNVAEWPDAPYRTTSGQPLHYFSGDQNAGDTNGAEQAGWTVYTGGVVATS